MITSAILAAGFLVHRDDLGRPDSLEGMIAFLVVVLLLAGGSLAVGSFAWTRAVDRTVAAWDGEGRPDGSPVGLEAEAGTTHLLPPRDRGPFIGPGG